MWGGGVEGVGRQPAPEVVLQAMGFGLWAGLHQPKSEQGWAKLGRQSKAQEVCYVSTCVVEGMETNSRRIFLAISILFCAIISAFWMSWKEYP